MGIGRLVALGDQIQSGVAYININKNAIEILYFFLFF